MKRSFINTITLLMISCVLQSCLSIPSNKVNIEEFPKAKTVKNLNIRVVNHPGGNWVYDITDKGFYIALDKNRPELFTPQEDGCSLDFYSYTKTTYSKNFDKFYTYASAYTLYIFPYYAPRKIGTTRKLLDAQTGEILKEYDYEERASKIISLPLFILTALNPLSYAIPAIRDNIHTPEGAKSYVITKTKEALIRQVTNDAYNFEQCLK